MKNYSFTFQILALFLLLSNQMYSQNAWEDPQAITDSLTNNINPILVHSVNSTFIFYEKIGDAGFSSIYMQNFNYLHNEIELFSEEGINYRNPQILNFNYWKSKDDLMFILLFESDMENEGIYSIFYSNYNSDDGFSEPTRLSILDGISCENMKAQGTNVVWKKGVELNYCFHNSSDFSIIQTLDFEDAEDIALGNTSIAFKKFNNNQIELYYAEKSDSGLFWDMPESIYSGEVSYINTLFADFMIDMDHGLLFENKNEDLYQIFTFDAEYGIDSINIYQDSSLQPTAIYYDLFVKNNQIFFHDLAVRKIINDQSDIYVNHSYDPEELINISNSEFEEINPKLCFYNNQSYNVVLFWESIRNNHSQLFMTKKTFWIGTNEKTNNKNFNLYPNPTSSQINIKLSKLVNSDYQIELLDINQKTIAKLYSGDIESEETLNLNIPNEVSNGVYFIRLSSKDFSETQKLLIAR